MIKNHLKHIKLTQSMAEEIKIIAQSLGFRETDLIRFLLNSAIKKLKASKQKAGGYDNLEFSLVE